MGALEIVESPEKSGPRATSVFHPRAPSRRGAARDHGLRIIAHISARYSSTQKKIGPVRSYVNTILERLEILDPRARMSGSKLRARSEVDIGALPSINPLGGWMKRYDGLSMVLVNAEGFRLG